MNMNDLNIKGIRKKLGLTQVQLAKKLGVDTKTIQNWEYGKRIPESKHGIIRSLLSAETTLSEPKPQQYYGGGNVDEHIERVTLPLIPYDVLAGFPNVDNLGISIDGCEKYTVPEFSCRGAEFLIRVSGDSMFPRYNNGDLLACKRITNVTFIQWGKVYVIDTTQGILVKHLFPSSFDDKITCHSVNSDNYPDFDIPKAEIRSFSLVLGSISLV